LLTQLVEIKGDFQQKTPAQAGVFMRKVAKVAVLAQKVLLCTLVHDVRTFSNEPGVQNPSEIVREWLSEEENMKKKCSNEHSGYSARFDSNGKLVLIFNPEDLAKAG